MKRIVIRSLIIVASVIAAISCTKEGNAPDQASGNQPVAGKSFTISATLSDALTKVTFTPGTNGSGQPKMALTWEAGDKLRVVNHADPTNYSDFDLAPSSVGNKEGKFTGTPVVADFYDVWVIHPNVEAVQTQASDGDASHIEYIAQANGIASANLSNIVLTDISSVLGIQAKFPSGVAETINSVKLKSSGDIFFGGKTLTIDIDTPGDADGDDILNLYATLPMGDQAIAAGTELLVKFYSNDSNHTVYTRYVELPASTFSSSSLNNIKLNAVNSGSYANASTDAIGTSTNPYLIGDKYQLLAVADKLEPDATRYFKMIDDVDMDGISWSYLNTASPYNQLIDFDGNGKTISNLGGTMFYVFKGAVRNLTLDSSSVTAGTHKGVFATYIQGTNNTLTNVKIQNVASFEGSSGNCGGMVGRINSGSDGYPTVTFDGCVVSNVPVNSGGTSAGGFIGSVEAKVVMDNCTYTGANVTNTSKTSDKGYAGGLIGFASAEVSITGSKVVNAKIAGYDAIGGMIGNINSGGFGNLTSCSVKADVSGRNYIGGFIGRERIASGVTIAISKCSFESYEDGVSGTNQYVGGIIGNQYGSGTVTIENSYVNSPVIATDAWAGGISGNHYNGTLTIGRCYVMGSVSAKYGAGGIVGQVRVANLTINPCAVYVSSISATATDSDPHESSGTIVAYGYNVNVTIARNCWYDQTLTFTECPGNAGSPSTWTPAREGGLSNAKISGGTPHSKIYPYWGRYTNPSDYPLNRMCKEILECSSDIWNLDVNPPILK